MIVWKGIELALLTAAATRRAHRSPARSTVGRVLGRPEDHGLAAPGLTWARSSSRHLRQPLRTRQQRKSSDDEALEDLGEAAVDRAAVQRETQGKVSYDLTHKRFSELMRPQFSLV
jgi:hypothetical protein